jgi:hypothetical protein
VALDAAHAAGVEALLGGGETGGVVDARAERERREEQDAEAQLGHDAGHSKPAATWRRRESAGLAAPGCACWPRPARLASTPVRVAQLAAGPRRRRVAVSPPRGYVRR